MDPRSRVLLTLAWALTVVSLQGIGPLVLAVVIGLVLGLAPEFMPGFALSRAPDNRRSPWQTVRRLLPLQLFMLVLLLTLPFSVDGPTLLRLGGLSASTDGLMLALHILLKANAVLLVSVALLGHLEPARLGHALARLGLPYRLAHLLLFTVRQIQLVGEEYRRLRQAMRARAFTARTDRHTWNSLGWLMGMLLVRSFGRARRLHDAMRCRGFDGRLRPSPSFDDGAGWAWLDRVVLAGVLLGCALLVMLDRIPLGVSA
ncbi:cobalt ECF transporter T component CbiQ [Thiohalocapsa marina]|uniref:Cobalt ECF transporter T component CbiQ n=1 Tax=Thiohalocapsa marina TaxID=424902 RepID=A0A5M8FQ81_9GAMM|nr:cobalt ECF transporter T component CbiQ [Thiohalocapsa marina]